MKKITNVRRISNLHIRSNVKALVMSFAVAMFLAMGVMSQEASALNINMNFFRPSTNGGNGPVAAGGLNGPAGGALDFWNQSSSSSGSALKDSTNTTTTVGYTSTNLGGPDKWGNPSLALLAEGLRNFDTSASNSQQFVINGLTAGDLYDVYLASANILNTNIANFADQRSHGQWSTTNATTTVGPQIVDNRFNVNGSTWVQGNNYVLFENVAVNGSGQLVFNGFSINGQPDFDVRLPLNGFQLVEVAPAIPEPATASLALLGLGGLVLRRRRAA